MLVVPENYVSDLTEWTIKWIIKSVKSVKDQKEISIRDHPFSTYAKVFLKTNISLGVSAGK